MDTLSMLPELIAITGAVTFLVTAGLGWLWDAHRKAARRELLLRNGTSSARAEEVVRYFREVGDSTTG